MRHSAATDLLVLDTDQLIGGFDKMLGSVLRSKKAGPRRTGVIESDARRTASKTLGLDVRLDKR